MGRENKRLEFAEVSQGFEQHCHSEPVRTTFVGISIEFRAAYRHTDRSFFVLFPGIYLCVIEKWYSYPGDCYTRKADWFAMTGNSPNSYFPRCCIGPAGNMEEERNKPFL